MSELSIYEKQLVKKRKTGIPRLLEIAGTKSIYLVVGALFAIIAVSARITPYITIYLLVRELLLNIGDIQAIDVDYVWQLGWITLGGIALYGVMNFCGSMLSHLAAFNILFEIRTSLAAKLARLPMGYFSTRTSGGIKKILSEDVERIELFVAHHILEMLQAVILPIVTFAFLFFMDWRLALAVLAPIPLAFLVQRSMYGKDQMELYRSWHASLSAMNGTIVEYVRGMPVVKVFNQTVSAFKRFSQDVYAYRDLTLYWIKISSSRFSAFLVLLNASVIFVLPVSIYLLVSVEEPFYVQLVTMVFLFLYIGMGIALPLYKMMFMMSNLIQINTGLEEIDDILTAPEISEPEDPGQPADASIEFKAVDFAYDEKTVLNGISFTVAPKTVTALVGPSGGGKSTISNLIARFWDVKGGEIRIGGTDIRKIPVEMLNDTISTVFQDVFLFFDTIEENIRMGNSTATMDEVIGAARAAQIHDFIENLPDGYQTLIGEGGTYLSGGEAQRISLARAILKDAPIVVLDEATAYADPENESRIQQALSHVLRDKTVVLIAHRLYTVTNVDQILVVDEGQIVEQGTHEELLSQEGLYHRLWGIHTRARDWNMNIETEEAR